MNDVIHKVVYWPVPFWRKLWDGKRIMAEFWFDGMVTTQVEQLVSVERDALHATTITTTQKVPHTREPFTHVLDIRGPFRHPHKVYYNSGWDARTTDPLITSDVAIKKYSYDGYMMETTHVDIMGKHATNIESIDDVNKIDGHFDRMYRRFMIVCVSIIIVCLVL